MSRPIKSLLPLKNVASGHYPAADWHYHDRMSEPLSDRATAPPSSFWRELTSPSFFLATGAGVGLLRFAPGTLGSIWGIPLALALSQLPNIGIQAAVLVGLNLIGIPICAAGAKRMNRKDPRAVVWDEIATIPMTFFLIPAAELFTWPMLLAGFGLHRLFDISKFPPANKLEKLSGYGGGLGIMADDWAAGIWSCLALHGLRWLGLFTLFG